jgi:hypothetical protein
VEPAWLTASAAAPAASSQRITSTCPLAAAQCAAVCPVKLKLVPCPWYCSNAAFCPAAPTPCNPPHGSVESEWSCVAAAGGIHLMGHPAGGVDTPAGPVDPLAKESHA